AAAVAHLRAATCRALVCRLVAAVLDEEQLDTSVRGGLERLLPTCGGPAVPRRFLAPAVKQLRLPPAPPPVEHRPHGLEDLRRVGVRLRRRPADERSLHLLGEELLEVRPHVLGADEDDTWPAQRPDAPVERLRDATPVAVDDLVDVSLVPRLRPAALIVLPGHVVAFVGDLDEAAAVEPVHLAALAADGSDERVPGAARETRQRRKVELGLGLHLVGGRRRQRERAPEVVAPRGEGGHAARPLTL